MMLNRTNLGKLNNTSRRWVRPPLALPSSWHPFRTIWFAYMPFQVPSEAPPRQTQSAQACACRAYCPSRPVLLGTLGFWWSRSSIAGCAILFRWCIAAYFFIHEYFRSEVKELSSLALVRARLRDFNGREFAVSGESREVVRIGLHPSPYYNAYEKIA